MKGTQFHHQLTMSSGNNHELLAHHTEGEEGKSVQIQAADALVRLAMDHLNEGEIKEGIARACAAYGARSLGMCVCGGGGGVTLKWWTCG
jgi:hypothetical protein